MKNLLLQLLIILVLCSAANAQSKTKASSPFAYIPDNSEDRYNQRITQKAIPTGDNEFIILSRTSESKYAVEKYNSDLKKIWSAAIPVISTETVDAFFINKDAAIVVTHRNNGQGSQRLYGYSINLSTGAQQKPSLLLEAPASARKASITASADGSKIMAYRYYTDGNHQIRSIGGTLYDGNLTNIRNTNYNLTDLPGVFSADVKLSNSGDQYISLISDNMRRLTVRQYPMEGTDVNIMSVLVGGVFEGSKVYVMDSRFTLMPNGQLYGAVLTADENSGQYYSLKTVKFSFEAKDMVFAEEFKFTPAYLASINQLDKSTAAKPARLEDIYLSDLILTPEQKLVVMAEKKYVGGGENSPYFAREVHLFAYDEFMNKAWNSVLMKYQKAPAYEAFTGISYKAQLFGNNLHLLTLEELNGKYDLYLRSISTSTGTVQAPKAVGLNVANDKSIAYVKDFTAWLNERNIITVVRPTKKAKGLQLSRILLK